MFTNHANDRALPSDCDSEQTAADKLGYTRRTWDNLSGKETTPSEADNNFARLSHRLRVAAVALGYTQKTWDNLSGKEKLPAAADKKWDEMTNCGEDFSSPNFLLCHPSLLHSVTVDTLHHLIVTPPPRF